MNERHLRGAGGHNGERVMVVEKFLMPTWEELAAELIGAFLFPLIL